MIIRLGGYLNLLIAIVHLIGLFWAKAFFELTGAGEAMEQLAAIHASIPYLLTVIVAIVFAGFGLYGLSGAGQIRPLPYLRKVLFLIAGIYLFRGVGELIWDTLTGSNSILETLYSLIALSIGLMYLHGARQLSHQQKLRATSG